MLNCRLASFKCLKSASGYPCPTFVAFFVLNFTYLFMNSYDIYTYNMISQIYLV